LDKPIRYVPAAELQALFNGRDFDGRVRRGELVVAVVADRHPSRTKAGEPHCTRSQMIQYRRRDGYAVALAHRYLRMDGSVGGSGRPDPKRIYLASEILSVGPGGPTPPGTGSAGD
jgi:hypothetical protein